MRELDVQCIADKIAQLCVEANHYLGEDIKACIRQKAEEETWPVAKDVLASIEENIAIAEEGVFPERRCDKDLIRLCKGLCITKHLMGKILLFLTGISLLQPFPV